MTPLEDEFPKTGQAFRVGLWLDNALKAIAIALTLFIIGYGLYVAHQIRGVINGLGF